MIVVEVVVVVVVIEVVVVDDFHIMYSHQHIHTLSLSTSGDVPPKEK